MERLRATGTLRVVVAAPGGGLELAFPVTATDCCWNTPTLIQASHISVVQCWPLSGTMVCLLADLNNIP